MLTIAQQLNTIPDSSGSYQFFDKTGEIIYVGKAKNLKRRVSSYFHKKHESPKLQVMVPQIVKIEFIVTDSEVEALILESHLIKKYKPKYNVLLKDDKKFPYFLITKEEYPRILVVRKQNRNALKGKYFGPYTNSKAMYATLDLLKKIFPLKQCKQPKFKDRPCLYYQMGRCLAPCQGYVKPEEYQNLIKKVELFLSGKQNELVAELKKQMEKYSKNQEYEKAAKYRDSYLDVMKTMEKQKVVFENTKLDIDIIALAKESLCACVCVLQIRQGRLTNKKEFDLKLDIDSTTSEIFSSFIKDYYEMVSENEAPKEILFEEELIREDKQMYEKWLSYKFKKNIKLISDKTKKNSDFISLAQKNAQFSLDKFKLKILNEIQNDYNEVGAYIQEKLGLKKFPHRVECFDISHIQGTNTVASMVVFENGQPKKSDYRRYKIKSAEGKPDDFKSMKEVVSRRYRDKIMPDLIIIDGGKGQLSSVMSQFNEMGIEGQDIVSLAKRLEEVFKPYQSKPVIFPVSSSALYFFQRIRDEAHRFAITYHRKLRGKSSLKSILDDIKGLSDKNKKILLAKYKSIDIISKLSEYDLEQIITKRGAKAIYEFFKQNL